MEDEPRRKQRRQNVGKGESEIRKNFSDDDLPRPKRRYEQNLECATLLLARERDRRHERGDEREHERDEAGHEEIGALQRRVEAHPARQRYEHGRLRPFHQLALEVRQRGAHVALHRRPAVRVRRVGDEQHRRAIAACESIGERGREHHGDVRRSPLEQAVQRAGARRHAHDPESRRGLEPATESQRQLVGGGIDDRDAQIAHVGAQREAEQDHLQQRHEQQDGQRLPVAEDVVELLPHEGAQGARRARGAAPRARAHAALSGRASRTNTSSIVRWPKLDLSSAGVPSAAMRPSTMIETRSQYSASSM